MDVGYDGQGGGGGPFRAFLYGAVTIFGIVVLYNTVWENAIMSNVEPILREFAVGTTGLAINASTAVTVNNGYDTLIFMIRIVPPVLIFGVILYMIISAIRKQTSSELM